MNQILCSISTKGRYDTTLPSAIQSVIFQTKKVDKLVIYDDNDEPKDLREIQLYQYLFQMLDLKNIAWECVYAKKMGQHHNHQMANTAGYDWVWRIDDDCVAEPTTLEMLFSYTSDEVGAVGGSVLTPPFQSVQATGKIENIDLEPNMQWDYIHDVREVDHLHCSFLYRAGVVDYNLGLSKVAHREETLFTYGLKQRGYKILVVPDAVTWHLKNKHGGIRTGVHEMFEHDEHIFRNTLKLADRPIVVLDNGMGDHVVFKKILPELDNPIIFSCFPDIIPGRSIQEAKDLFGNIDQYSIYAKMDQWNWQGSLENAFRKLYVK
jgi:hypothetical protein